MRTASMVLGIIGGVVVMLWGLLNCMITNFVLISLGDVANAILLGTVLCILAAGVPGLVGGIIVKRKNIAAGVLMIVSAVLSIFAFLNIVAIILFTLGAIFALIKEQPKPAVPYPPQPPYPYYQYSQYPVTPQQPQPPAENSSEPSQEP